MEKYVLKHIKIGHLKSKDCFLQYVPDIDQKHCVFTLDEATRFETEKKAKQIRKKFKHPDLWEVKVINE